MRIASGTGTFWYIENPTERLNYMKSLGFTAADWDLADIKDEIYHDDDAMKTYCQLWREASEATGVELYQTHGPWPTDDTTAESRAEGWRCFHRAVYMCHLAGSPRLVIHPQMPFGWGGVEDPEVAYQVTLDLLRDLMPDCEKYGVTICLENMPFLKQRISTMDRIAEVVRAVDSPYAKICLDTGHVNVFEGADLGEAVRQAGDLLDALHVHDNVEHRDMHRLPWWGNANWDHFIEELAKSGYQGPLTLETSGNLTNGLPMPLRLKANQLAADVARYMADRVEELRK